jgi:hypothetical protein
MNKKFLIASVIIILLGAAAFVFQPFTTDKELPAAQDSTAHGQLIDLDRFEQLEQAFQGDSGNVRLITLLSPT